MKSRNPIIIVIILTTFFITSCSVEHNRTDGESKNIINEVVGFEIDAKIGKTIEVDYGLHFESGFITIMIQDIHEDTLLHQTHIRDLKGKYYIKLTKFFSFLL